MFSNTSFCQRSIGAGWVILAIAFTSVGARGEGLSGVGGAVSNAVGGAVSGVSGAVGSVGGALKGGSVGTVGSRAVGSSLDEGNGAASVGGVGGVGGIARSGNWVGAPYVVKIDRGSEGQDSCGDTLIDFLYGRKCQYRSPGAASEDLDQASYTDDSEPVVPNIAPQPQAPATMKATSPKSIARLNVEKPAVEKPELTVAPKSVQPKAVDKAQPQSSHILSCSKAETIVGGYGFSGVKPSDCDGQVFGFNASRDGKSFLITLNALSGELIQVRKLPPTAAP